MPHQADVLYERWVALALHGADEDTANRLVRFRRSLLAQIIGALPRLILVVIYIREIFPPGMQGFEVQDATRTAGGRITSILIHDFGVQTNTYATEEDLGHLITRLPNLEVLNLDVYLLPAGRATLQRAITSLPSLRELYIRSEGHYLNPDLLNLPWRPLLKALALVSIRSLTLPTLVKLLTHVGDTLEWLHLRNTPKEISEREAEDHLYPIPFPKLKFFNLTTPHDARQLRLFVTAPLGHLSVGFCPQIEAEEWLSFVAEHSSTLRQVEVETVRLLRKDELARLKARCADDGIEFACGTAEWKYFPDAQVIA